jgi:hypothetical protein
MRQPISHVIQPYAFVAVLCFAGAIALHVEAPTVLNLVDSLLTEHTVMFGAWLALSAAGADYVITTLHRKLRLGEVGAKSAAQLHISRG